MKVEFDKHKMKTDFYAIFPCNDLIHMGNFRDASG